MVLHFCGPHTANKRYEGLLANASKCEEKKRLQSSNNVIEAPLASTFDSQMLLDHSVPAGLKMRDIFVVSSHHMVGRWLLSRSRYQTLIVF